MKIADGKKASILIFLLLSTFFYFLSFAPISALYGDGENWLSGWIYRKSHIIEHDSGAGTNYQVKITVHYDDGTDSGEHVYLNSKCQSDFGDIRFTDDDGWTLLDYWMESKNPETSAVFWVEVQDDLSSSDATIYIYYGNDEATTTSSGSNTFLLFYPFDNSDELDDFTKETFILVGNSNEGQFNVTHETETGNSAPSLKMAYNMDYISGDPVGRQYIIHKTINIDSGLAVLADFRATSSYSGSSVTNARSLICKNEPLQVSSILYEEAYFAGGSTDSGWQSADEYYVTTELEGYSTVKVGFGARDGWSANWNQVTYFDNIRVRKYVDPEPSHGSWGEETGNYAPTNLSFAFLDMDDTDNLYAQKQYYTAQYVVIDYDGYADIDYAEFSIVQSSDIRATFRFDEDTATFSIEAGGATWDLDVGSCSYVSSGETITMNFKISPKFNAIEESDIDISAFVVDDEAESNTDTIQTDYADVVTDLVVFGFACDDDRGNVGQPLEFSGTVSYANNPSSGIASSSYPPDSEFTAVHVYDSRDVSQGSDNSIINGTFSVSFSALSSVDLEAYNPYIDMADAEYTDAEENPTDTFISDRIRILTLGADDTRVNVDDSAEIYATAELEYDGHSLGSGDGLTIESLDLIWNTTHFVGTESKPSVQQKVYDEGEGEETTYGVTALNLDSRSVSVIWDRLNVTFTVDDDLVPLNTETEFKVTIFREYDNSSVSSYSYNINRDGSGFSNPHTTEAFTDVSSSEGTRIYDFTNVIDNTYGLTAFTDPNDLFVAWYDEGIQLNQIVLIVAVALIVIAIAAGVGLLIYLRKRK